MAKAKCHKCEEKCGEGKVHPDILQKLDAGFKVFYRSDSKSLLKKYLTRDVFDKLKTKKTSFGSSLLDCIQSGFANPDSQVGIYAADPEAYIVFAEIFDPIIQDYHLGFKKSDLQPPTDYGAVEKFGDIDPKCEFVVSTRVRTGRTLEGFPFNPCLTENQYKEIEMKVKTVLCDLTGPLKGQYYPLSEMTPEEQKQLIDDHFLFKEGDKYLQAANASRFWPVGRGIFYNDDKTFLVWINEEDHLRIISLQQGGNLGEVYRRFVSGLTELEKKLPFIKNDRLGNLTFCPSNLGTAIRASIHVKLPKLSSNMSRLNELAGKYNLQVRGTRGEHSDAEDGIYDISNKRRLGLTEGDAIKEMFEGVTELIKQERA